MSRICGPQSAQKKDRCEENCVLSWVHPDDLWLYCVLEKIAFKVSDHYHLELAAFEPMYRPGDRVTGLAYCDNNVIQINFRTFNGGSWSKRREITHILYTIAHELSHLRYWRHGHKHTKFQNCIMAYMRRKYYLTLLKLDMMCS